MGRNGSSSCLLTAALFEGLNLPGSIDFEGRGKAHEKWDRIRIGKRLEIDVERNEMEYWLNSRPSG